MNVEKETDDWVRVASKSRPGRFYIFNKATGETQWQPLKSEIDGMGKPALKLSTKKISRTPAQDRLKTLQYSLKLRQLKSRVSSTKANHLREQKNEFDDGPSTSASSKSVVQMTKKPTKRSYVASLPSEKTDLVKSATSLVEENLKTDSTSNIHTSTANESLAVSVHKENSNTGMNISTVSNIRSGIVKKIKEIFKLPFNVPKKFADEGSHRKVDDSLGLTNTTKFKTTYKKSKQIPPTLAMKEPIITQLKEEIKKSPEDKILTCSLPKSTLTDKNFPPYPRGSANSRLERLKEYLHLQHELNSAKYSSDASTATGTNKSKALLFQKDSQPNSNTADILREDETEAMDWQAITKEGSQSEALTFKPTLALEKSRKLVLKAVDYDDNLTMGNIIDTVNENLLRFSAERQKEMINSNRKWCKDFYYFVVDTNVLLQNLTFVEDLLKMKLCDTEGSLLYIPYAVLQELDKLKMRSGSNEGVKTLAVRAIKYLNNKLENNSVHLQAQSAVEEQNHLIDVNSADDSIINCCLQVKDNIPNLILLTEDVNLRNKAMCNNIMVSTKSDLLAKRYDFGVIS